MDGHWPVARIGYPIVAERHIGDRQIEEPVRQGGGLEALDADIGARIERLGDAAGDRIDLNAGPGDLIAQMIGRETDEMADACRRFEHTATGKAEMIQGPPHAADHRLAGIVGVQR